VAVVLVAAIRHGVQPAPHCAPAHPLCCPLCRAQAVLPLDSETRKGQPDGTTHVCHPVLGGCNHGFTREREGA
jgi:hypothetical protein